ncbi:response regulator transcription factor [Streptomyces sp. Je 1-79]|uniref:response regulator transcription factor n=1 Tax=Streptomyces sp. Je 1-79 TaxID=2943847 RepID=UPI0021A9140C|nr:response regulator transcription factor [Streptomyces sp. Je 1-79]MCT4356217.1 response regulator transcription factor [Streptomyces sp. Je 1-79]
MNVLIVDDDDEAADELDQALTSHGYRTERACTGEAALRQLSGGTTLVLLDLSLPDLAGHEVCRRIRESSCVPVIAMSNDDDELDRVITLHMGADDIMRRSYGHRELMARIQAVLRRCGSCRKGTAEHPGERTVKGPEQPPGTRSFRVGELQLDVGARLVMLREREVRVTRREFELLAALMANPGVVMERRDIITRVWGENWFGSTRTLDVHVGSLRGKLGRSEWIQTVRGVGYKLMVPVSRTA